MKLKHAGQIVTTKKTIIGFIDEIRTSVTHYTVRLISDGLNGRDDYLRLYGVCTRLYYLSKLVYVGKNGVMKLKTGQYRKEIFDLAAETPDEVRHILEGTKESIHTNHVEEVFRCLKIIEELWCKGIACVSEQIYIAELAYAFDYVIKRRGELPEPEFQGEWSMFPHNYENYNYTEGIAKYFEDLMESIF